MSMHNQSEGSFERINKSMTADKVSGESDEGASSRKRCIIITITICALVAAITALVLVLVLQGSGTTIPPGYNGYSIQEETDGKWFYEATLKRTSNATGPVKPSENNPEFDTLKMRASMMQDNTVRLKINPVKDNANGVGDLEDIKRWEIPKDLLGNTKDDYGMRLSWANFESELKPAGVKLSNPNVKDQYYLSTKNRNLVFMDKYIELGFEVDSRKVFGFGERQKTFELNTGEYTSWASGRDNHLDEGHRGGHSYGDHPFVLIKLNTGAFAGIFFANSNAKTLHYTHVAADKSILNFRAVGGVLDFYTFFAENPEDVIKAYHEVIGPAYLPPFWALGFHQSSWQYKNQAQVEEVMKKYDENKIPLEGMWLDIDYMNHYQNFIVNMTAFKNIPNMAKAMHNKGQKLIPIVDAGFHADEEYKYYKMCNEQQCFIKSAKFEQEFNGNLIGNVWPGKAAFPDFLHPKAESMWHDGLTLLHSNTTYDGIWIDMNEATTFCPGECPTEEPTPPEESTFSRNLSEEDDDDEIWSVTGDLELEHYSLSMDAKHYGETEEEKALHTEYNLHSLFGTYQARATYNFWLHGRKFNNERPFVLSRSTFAGAGKWTSHWLGDNWANWEFMKYSVAGLYDFNMFGIPLVGADICGFHSPTEDELCGRWHQLSTFYPFARNHNNWTDLNAAMRAQEPYTLEEPWNTVARNAIIQRYEYLRYMYTRLYEINQNGGGTLIRPLFFEFPEDDQAYQGYEHTFMVGDALKVTPILEPESVHGGNVNSYFPAGSRFISMNDKTTILEGGEKGTNHTLEASKDHAIVHLREGKVIPWQYMNREDPVMTTKTLIENEPINLVVFPDTDGNAEGYVYIDENGDDFIDIERNAFQYYKLRYKEDTLSIEKFEGDMSVGPTNTGNQVIDNIYIMNAGEYANKEAVACAYNFDFEPIPIEAQYDEEWNALKIEKIGRGALLFKEIMAVQFADENDDTTFCNAEYKIKSKTERRINGKEADIIDAVDLVISSGDKPHLPDLNVEFRLIDERFLNVKIYDPDVEATQYEAPTETFDPDFLEAKTNGVVTFNISTLLTLPEEGEVFFYEVHKNKPKSPYYSTKGQQFVFSQYYKRHAAKIASSGQIFGLGERVGNFFLDEGVYTLWNRDATSPIEDGLRPGNNIYGTHPIYFNRIANNEFFGVYDHNVGAQDYVIKKTSTKNQYQITQIKTSGITDQYIILSTDIQEMLQRYQEMVGKPAMVPEWALGWHQCRYGYNNTEQVDTVVNQFIENKIPLDVMWTDIDYMEQYQDFTLSSTDFKDLPQKVQEWRNNHNIRYVPILDGGIAYTPGEKDSSYERGLSLDLYIKDGNHQTEPFIGKVWPGPAVFVDWYHDSAEKFWVEEMQKLYEILPYDGMWIDMNEASNFCDGFCTNEQEVKNSIQKQLFYTPGGRDLNAKSISIDAVHENGITEFQAHSTYGFYMGKATNAFFKDNLNKRQFIITRSSFSGSGKYTSKWLGDNFSTWDYLKYSVSGIFNFQFLGMPVVGADICGFIDDTNAKLCARWYAVGAFYPFARNHNDKNSIPQEPFVPMLKEAMPGTNGTYTDFIRRMALKRYALHRYHYQNVHGASRGGTPYFTPVFYKYPNENQAYNRVEQNIMLGESIKVSAVVADTTVKGSYYFPDKKALWCPLWPEHKKQCFSGGGSVSALMASDEVFVHLKSGDIIVTQLGDLTNVPDKLNLETLKNLPVQLAVHPDSSYEANGSALYDDGETDNLEAYTEYQFMASGKSPLVGTSTLDIIVSTIKNQMSSPPEINQNLDTIVIYNAKLLSLGTKSKAEIEYTNGSKVTLEADYHKDDNMCKFHIKEANGSPIRNIKNIHITHK